MTVLKIPCVLGSVVSHGVSIASSHCGARCYLKELENSLGELLECPFSLLLWVLGRLVWFVRGSHSLPSGSMNIIYPSKGRG